MWKTFKLSELKLDQLNYRTGDQVSQRDAILAIIADQGEKLSNLARDIIDLGLSPGEPVWVTNDPDEPGKQIVLEGNRRVATLKILENPSLADGTPVAARFAEMAKEFASKPTRTVEARVFVDRDEAEPWIERRHMSATSGVSLQKWRTLAKGRFYQKKKQPVPRALAVLDFLDDDSDEFEAVGNAINAKATTVNRVLNAPPMKELLGVNIDPKTGGVTFENGDDAAGRKLLHDIVGTMAAPGFNFKEIEDKRDRATFLSKFADRSVKAKQEPGAGAAATPKASQPEKPAEVPKGRRAKPAHGDRATLAPKTGNLLHVQGARLNPLYDECRNIIVEDHRNASALLLRVFLELSSEMLLTKRQVALPKAIQDRKKKAWDDVGVKLSWKIQAAADYLDPTGNAKAFQQARIGADEAARSNYAVWTLHGYFHNPDLIPQASDLKGAWDAWEAYLRAVTDDLMKP